MQPSKEAFVEEITENGGSGKEFYDAVRQLSGPGGGSTWSVRQLFPAASDEQVCMEVLDYFSSVGGRERGRAMEEPLQVPSGLHFTPQQVLERLRNLKKKNSHVEGDPLPDLVRKMPELFASPVATIFNKASETATWPSRWKTEYITVIPKVKNPSSLAETRNISWTALLSKVLEGAMLEQLRGELVPDPEQYGGLKSCGAKHMLIDVWNAALSTMDEGKDAVVLLGVDFQKAFNRMKYAACMDQLALLGASPGSLAMVHSFLMGSALYCATTQLLQSPRVQGPPPASPADTIPSRQAGEQRTQGPLDLSRGVLRRRDQVRFFPASSNSEDSESDVQFWESPSPPREVMVGEDGEERNLGSFKYIDDTTLVQVVPLAGAIRHFTTSTTIEYLEPGGLGDRFSGWVANARDIGMEINCSKTKLLCMSPNNGCRTVAKILTPDGAVDSVDTLKLVGFVFGSKPTAAAHVDHLQEKFRIKVWLLFHLKEAGIKEDRLFKLYCVYIKLILEYCSPVYHSLLTAGQAETLERLQRHAARVCYGNNNIRDVMQAKGIETLEERRLSRVDRFIQKTVADVRFGPLWYPKRPDDGHGLRERRNFLEDSIRTSRSFNNPRNYLVRRANQLGLDW